MRTTAIALVALLVAGLGALAPASAAPARAVVASPPVNPKVAIIVGATGTVTPTYRAYADQLYAEAVKYTSNVVRVYSPSATWANVRSAVNGASVIVYLGHGNGWPSPYGNDAAYTTKDGFGLNYDANGDGKTTDSELKYYGEPSIRTLTPAPNAVVLLFHLCYASGNSEPGQPDPTLAVARQRADNYATAFQAMGARAVIAIGHSHDPYYIRALFTMRESIRDYFLNAPDYHGHLLESASARTPGRTVLLDPDQATPWGFWRSASGDLTLNTRDVTGASYGRTDGDPATLAVPGNATPVADGTGIYATAEDALAGTDPIATLPASTIVRVDSGPDTAAEGGTPVYAVHLDDGTTGFMAGSALQPRDSLAPRVWSVDDGAGTFSPDGNGVGDTLPISIRLSEKAAWSLKIADGGGSALASASGNSDTAALTWAPAPGSVPDGTYTWSLSATDAYGNGPLEAQGTLTVDLDAPTLTVAGDAAPRLFTPNGDGVADTVSLAVSSSEAGSALASVRDAGGAVVASLGAPIAGRAATLTWNGTASSGAPAPDGVYTLSLTVRDLAGNASDAQERQVVVDRTLASASLSKALFFPQDGDSLAPTVAFGFTLNGPASVDWAIVNSAGAVVRTIKAGESLVAGRYGFTWNGRDNAGRYVARGWYRAQVTATDGLATLRLSSASVLADAFRFAVSDTTPGRGQRITVTVYSAEGLRSAPRLTVVQPRIAAWSVSMVRVSSGVYRATITLRKSSTGTLRLKVSAPDTAGRSQYSNLYLPLH